MCWPRLEGGLEIEERYPRTTDPREPRRRRLNFVRSSSHSRRNSSSPDDDFALMHSTFFNARPIRAEMRERHDPRMLQQQENQMRQLHGQNQQLHGQNQQLLQQLHWDGMRRRQEIEHAQQAMLQHGHGHPPPPPPPGHHPHEQQRIEPVYEEWHPPAQARPNYVEIAPRPRSRMPHHLQHGGRSPSRGRAHGRHHSGTSIYSDDLDSLRDCHRRRPRSPVVYG
ncbi:MAG: hypothetical protein Q9223_001439, partial [Gallowayella weberi]